MREKDDAKTQNGPLREKSGNIMIIFENRVRICAHNRKKE